ncbi:ATP F0F1 synthase subunit B [Rhodobacterales bacterium HKCCE3408]|nr:ATP F0F1 synthase subunit B [Rhodobacterales bacterium HKCCE3408]
MRRLWILAALLAPVAAHAAEEGGYETPHGLFAPSLTNTDFVVAIGFLLFLAVLFYFNVPGTLMGLLDKRAKQIESDLNEARALRDEAQAVLASYERKQREVAEQAERIVAAARSEAENAAELAKADLQESIERRLKAAEEQITNAEQRAVGRVRDRAVEVAVAAAAEVLKGQTSATEANKLIDASIETVGQRLN